METTTTTEHGHRVTSEWGIDGRWRWYADCPCGAESGPFDTAEGARGAFLNHRRSSAEVAR